MKDKERFRSTTESVCPECLRRVDAARVAEGDTVYLEKRCPEHGEFRTIIWRGEPAYDTWIRPRITVPPRMVTRGVERGCPFDCGICSEHRQDACLVLLEVTRRCNLRCAFCYADAGSGKEDPGLPEIEGWYRRLLEAGVSYNVQLSGGEPTLRDDLPEIIEMGRGLGLEFIQVNTNGLRIAREPGFLERLQRAGLSSVFLQFDGTEDAIYQKIRGESLLADKLKAVDRCAVLGIGVVLVPTLVRGVNLDNIGDIIDFARQRVPAVRAVQFQPVSFFGRYPQAPADSDRVTLPEVVRMIEEQTGGKVRGENLSPPGWENPACSFYGSFVVMPEGRLMPLTHPGSRTCCQDEREGPEAARRTVKFMARYWSAQPQETGVPIPIGQKDSLDIFLERVKTHTLVISGMGFQDAWNLDLDRLRDCCIHVVAGDGLLVPFCAYNLTDRQGRPLYRRGG
ncbi:MAG: radical SAM protein [Firmicutes bacterium]|nr:radical SAM protein [Bacillota bacterium]